MVRERCDMEADDSVFGIKRLETEYSCQRQSSPHVLTNLLLVRG